MSAKVQGKLGITEGAEAPVPGRDGEPPAALLAELSTAADALEGAPAPEVIRWAVERFGDGLVLTSSFQDAVLVDLAVRVEPGIHVVFLDTGFHFPETLAYLRRVERRYGLNLEVVSSGLAPDESPCGSADCCERRKVAPLNRVLSEKAAWMTGVKRADTPERADSPVVAFDRSKQIVKVNPLVAWSEDEVWDYVAEHDLPRHPLNAVGYLSIGCAPTTRPVAEGEDPRAGRWPGSDKTECGLHL